MRRRGEIRAIWEKIRAVSEQHWRRLSTTPDLPFHK
jgi:hypothetical protein